MRLQQSELIILPLQLSKETLSEGTREFNAKNTVIVEIFILSFFLLASGEF